MRYLFSIGLLCACWSFVATAAEPNPAPFPSGIELDGWSKAGGLQNFKSSELYGHINGGAEIFLELGFDLLQVQNFVNEKAKLSVEIYRMRDTSAALGIYLMKCGRGKPSPKVKARNAIGKRQLMLQKQRYFVLVTSYEGKQVTVETLSGFGENIADRLPAETPPEALSMLPEEGRVSGSLRIIRGPFGLNTLYTLGEGDILSLTKTVTAVAATYKDEKGERFTHIVAPYSSNESASKALTHLVANLDSYLKVIKSTKDELIFRDYDDKCGEVKRQKNQLVIKLDLTCHEPIKAK